MNTYSEKWNRYGSIGKPIEDTFSNFDNSNQFNSHYSLLKNDEIYLDQNCNKPSYDYSLNSNDKYYTKQNNDNKYKSHYKTNSSYGNDNDTIKPRLVGYSKYNSKKEISNVYSSQNEKINNNVFIANLESKDSGHSQNSSDHACDTKSINSVETQNTINEDEIDKVEDCFSKNRYKTEDLKSIKNSKLSCLNTHQFNYNKFHKYQEDNEEKHVRNNNTEAYSSYSNNKFSHNNTYMFENKRNNLYPNYLFNPFMLEGSGFPFFNPSNMFPQTPPQYAFGNFNPNYYNMNMNCSNMGSYSHSTKQTINREKINYMDQLTNLKEQCKALFILNKNDQVKPNSQFEKGLINIEKTVKERTDDIDTFVKSVPEINGNLTKEIKRPIITLSIRISKTVTKTIEIINNEDVYNVSKAFCKENSLSNKLLHLIYTNLNTALKTVNKLPTKTQELKEIFSCTSNVLSKLKRCNSFNSLLPKNII